MSGLFLPIVEVVVATVALLATAWWYNEEPATEPLAGIFIASAGVIGALCHLAYAIFHGTVSESEATERYQQQSQVFREARRQIANENSHLEKMLVDPSQVAGKPYAEEYPFSLIAEKVKQLEVYSGFKRSSRQVVEECERILTMPSGQRDVTRLVPMLKRLERKLCKWLDEPVS